MPRVLVLFAHPRLEKSRANRALLQHLPDAGAVTFHDLYERYPDFAVDIDTEQRLLTTHDVIFWHHPLYWYSAPPLVKQWIDLVLAFGWAYGPGGTALAGKSMGHIVTTGGADAAYQHDGFHHFTLAEFLRPLERTVTLCGMRWLPPFVVHGTHRLTDDDLNRAGGQYAAALRAFGTGALTADAVSGLATLNLAVPQD